MPSCASGGSECKCSRCKKPALRDGTTPESSPLNVYLGDAIVDSAGRITLGEASVVVRDVINDLMGSAIRSSC
jgi:hypothetical protein